MGKVTREHLKMIEAKRATVADIARMTGVSRQEISKFLKKYVDEKKKKAKLPKASRGSRISGRS